MPNDCVSFGCVANDFVLRLSIGWHGMVPSCVLGSFSRVELHATERGDVPAPTAMFSSILKAAEGQHEQTE
jgi:hypothetical protein